MFSGQNKLIMKTDNIVIKRFLSKPDSLEDQAILDSVIAIDEVSIDYCWTKKQWYDINYSHGHVLSCLIQEGQVLGFTLYSHDSLERDSPLSCHLLKIAVLREFRGIGLAQRLLKNDLAFFSEKVEENIELSLEVSARNVKAINFYSQFGFSTCHTAKKYYSDGSDALKMRYKLLQL